MGNSAYSQWATITETVYKLMDEWLNGSIITLPGL